MALKTLAKVLIAVSIGFIIAGMIFVFR